MWTQNAIVKQQQKECILNKWIREFFLKGRFWCRGEVPGRRQGLVGEKQRKLLLGVLTRSVPEKKQCVRKVNIENMWSLLPRLLWALYLNALQSHLENKKNGIPYILFLECDSALKLSWNGLGFIREKQARNIGNSPYLGTALHVYSVNLRLVVEEFLARQEMSSGYSYRLCSRV